MKRLLHIITLALSLAAGLQAQIPFGSGGTGTLTFDALPNVTEWSTRPVMGGGEGAITTTTGLDNSVATNTAAMVNMALLSHATVPPHRAGTNEWNSTGLYLQSRATVVAHTLLMATLHNESGSDVSAVTVSYDFGALVASGSAINESIYGLRVYYSLTGEANSWVVIPDLSAITNTTAASTVVALGSWAAGSNLYLLWADDNGPSSDTAPNREGGYTIDNFSVSPVSGALAASTSPASAAVNQCGSVTFRATATGGTPGYTYQWYKNDNANPLNGQTASSLVLSNVQPTDAGNYFVVVTDAAFGVASTEANPCALTVNADPGAPALLSALGQTNLTTVTVTFSKAVTISSGGGADFRVQPTDGSGDLGITSAVVTNATNVILTTATRELKNYRVVVQGAGVASACGGTPVVDGAQVPLVSQFTLIGLADATPWRYRDDGVDPGSDWLTADTATWSQGTTVFDHKRGTNRVYITASGAQWTVGTQLTMTNANYQNFGAAIPSYYFRTTFNFPGVPGESALTLRGLIDDGAAFYLNGQEGRRIRVTNDLSGQLSFNLYSPAAPGTETVEGPFDLPTTNVVTGVNQLAILLKQQNATSSDIIMGISLTATVTNFANLGPRLRLTRNGDGSVTVSWTPDQGNLQESTDLGNANGWSNSAIANGGTDTRPAPRFYRLHP